jgi:hypothetical protein
VEHKIKNDKNGENIKKRIIFINSKKYVPRET